MRKNTIMQAFIDDEIMTWDQMVRWLKRKRKDELYTLYMQATDYEGEDYRNITRNTLKDIFAIEFEQLQEIRKNDPLCF